jgi:large subunit ribosomal protein L24
MPLRLRRNDMVMIVSGDSRGQSGKIIKVLHKKYRAVVEGKNLVKRHTKPTRKVQQGGIIEKEASIHMSNLMLLDPKTGKATRVGMKVIDSGSGKKAKRVRYSKKAKELID